MNEDVELWRVYFNRREDWPFLVAVDNGTVKSQIRVQWFRAESVDIHGNSDVGMSRDSVIFPEMGSNGIRISARKGKPNEPTWWIEFEATAEFVQGGVIFRGAKPIKFVSE
jgi:hypothetical protein